ncbi:MAG: flagellar export protein FliJ [Armatimonadia bacterium]|nr:flagellar export protein FliJ [Armatimonadia bacterium]
MRSKPFQFSLQKVLEYRVHLEDTLRTELAELRRERAMLVERREQLETEVAERVQRLTAGEFDVLQVKMTTHYVNRLEGLIQHTRQRIAEMDEAIEEKRQALVEASRNRKVMEKLKETAYEEYRAEELRTEQLFLDELATATFNRGTARTDREASG